MTEMTKKHDAQIAEINANNKIFYDEVNKRIEFIKNQSEETVE